jgi:hypothetical protein
MALPFIWAEQISVSNRKLTLRPPVVAPSSVGASIPGTHPIPQHPRPSRRTTSAIPQARVHAVELPPSPLALVPGEAGSVPIWIPNNSCTALHSILLRTDEGGHHPLGALANLPQFPPRRRYLLRVPFERVSTTVRNNTRASHAGTRRPDHGFRGGAKRARMASR